MKWRGERLKINGKLMIKRDNVKSEYTDEKRLVNDCSPTPVSYSGVASMGAAFGIDGEGLWVDKERGVCVCVRFAYILRMVQ